jgi:hypothetical protein
VKTQMELLKIPASHRADLERARLLAEVYAANGRTVSMDDVKELFQEKYSRPLAIGNSAGHVFLNGKFFHVGYCKSRSPKARSRVIQTWQLKATHRPRPQQFHVGMVDGERICLSCGQFTTRCECTCPTALLIPGDDAPS